MADSEEESVYSYVVMSLVCLALALNEVCTLNAILAKETLGVMLVEYFDLVVVLNALAHNVRSTQIRLAYNHVHLLAQTCQIESLFTSSVATAYYGYSALAIEESVACGAGAHALTVVLLLVVQTKILGAGTCCYDYCISLNLHSSISSEHVWLCRKVSLYD